MFKTYSVAGLSSAEDCKALEEQVSNLATTQGVKVDLSSNSMHVTGEGFTDGQIDDAVEEAGFSLNDF